MKVIFNCYSCGTKTTHELTDREFVCPCGIVSSTTLAPSNSSIQLIKPLSVYDFKVTLSALAERPLADIYIDEYHSDLCVFLATLWVGFVSGKILSDFKEGPAVCSLIESAKNLINQHVDCGDQNTNIKVKEAHVAAAQSLLLQAVELM